VLHWTALALVNYAVNSCLHLLLFMKTSLHSIKLKHQNLARCNIWNSLHETNRRYENL